MRTELGFEVVTTAYGLTECGGLATICDPAAPPEVVAATSGRPIAGTEVSIRNAESQPLPGRNRRNLSARLPRHARLFPGPEATAEGDRQRRLAAHR